jgi:hypothetical protein
MNFSLGLAGDLVFFCLNDRCRFWLARQAQKRNINHTNSTTEANIIAGMLRFWLVLLLVCGWVSCQPVGPNCK